VVTQESFLFNGSIRENLFDGKNQRPVTRNYGARWIARTRDTSLSVCRRGLKRGGERGVKLSVWRETAALIARRCSRISILILDEATARWPRRGTLNQGLLTFDGESTSIVIAQRFRRIVGADQILVLDHGRGCRAGARTRIARAEYQKYAQLCRQSLLESSPRRQAEPHEEIVTSEVAEPEGGAIAV